MSSCDWIQNLFHKIISNVVKYNIKPNIELEAIKVIKYELDELTDIVYHMYNELYNEGKPIIKHDNFEDDEDTLFSPELSKKISKEFIFNIELYKEIISNNNNELLSNKILADKIYREYMDNMELFDDVFSVHDSRVSKSSKSSKSSKDFRIKLKMN